jgi:hypothetical protein
MATVAQKGEGKRGGVARVTQVLSLTMTAGAQTDVPFTIPEGSKFVRFQWATSAAFSGSPTNINLTVGSAVAGAQYVAAVDVKAATVPTAASLVTAGAADLISAPAGQTWHATLTAVGGTNPAGTCTVLVEYTPPAA